MSKPRLSFLTRDEIEGIHNASKMVLEKTGISIESKEALELLKRGGAKVNFPGNSATIPQELVEEAIKLAPKTIVYGARNDKYNLLLDKKRTYFSTDGFDAPFIVDIETRQRRRSTIKDLANWTRIADYLDRIDNFWPSLCASDIPLHMQRITSLVTALRNTEKHITYEALNAEEARFMIEIATAVAGSEKKMRERPIISAEQAPVPPLRFDKDSIEAAIEFSRAGIPVLPMTMPAMGVTAPASPAGSTVIANAEFLAELVILQLASSGAPVLYTAMAHGSNFATGCIIDSAEGMFFRIASVEIGHFYDLPCVRGYGGNTSAKLLDAQAGYEKGQNTLVSVLAGVDICGGCGELDDALCMCPESLVIENEIKEKVLKFAEGYKVNDETLALDLIDKVGSSGHFIDTDHTLAHYRDFWRPQISSKSTFSQWQESGSKSLYDVARDKVREILRTHEPVPLVEEVEKDLGHIMKNAEARLGGKA